MSFNGISGQALVTLWNRQKKRYLKNITLNFRQEMYHIVKLLELIISHIKINQDNNVCETRIRK